MKLSESQADSFTHYNLLLILGMLLLLGSTRAVLADEPYAENFLSRQVILETNVTAKLRGFLEIIRTQGFLMGSEIGPTSVPLVGRPEWTLPHTIEAGDDSAPSFLDRLKSMHNSFTWSFDESSKFINFYPEVSSLSTQVVSSCLIEDKSLHEVLAGDQAPLSKYNISFQHSGFGRPYTENIIVSMNFPGGTVAEFLNRLSHAIGREVSWTLDRGYRSTGVSFKFGQPFKSLESYRPPKIKPVSQQLQEIQDRLAKPIDTRERVSLLRKTALLHLKKGDLLAASNSYDLAIQTAESDEERWRLRGSRTHAFNQIINRRSAEIALEEYTKFMDACPYDHIKYSLIFEMVHAYTVLERFEDGVNLLKDAYEQYPEKRKVIRKVMMRRFPSSVPDLGPPPAPESGRIPDVFYQRLPATKSK